MELTLFETLGKSEPLEDEGKFSDIILSISSTEFPWRLLHVLKEFDGKIWGAILSIFTLHGIFEIALSHGRWLPPTVASNSCQIGPWIS